MTNKKICVYAICKNESAFIDRWLTSMSEADYIVVLDTGSTDKSLKILQNDKRVTTVKQKKFNPWRFDVARNESMKLVPEDAEILVCTDFDEIFEEGWAKVLRENWEDDDDRCHYTYAWSHNELGEPQDVFTYDKIHTKNYHWKYPVHEIVYPNDDTRPEKILDAGEAIYLHHLQDPTKSRSSYFDLLKIAVDENPEDSHCRMLLAREYLLKKNYDESLEEYMKCLDYDDIYDPNKKLVLLETLSRIGDINFTLGNYDNAFHFYREHLRVDDTHREPYFCMGELYNVLGLYGLAKAIVSYAMEYCTRHYDWTERKETWISGGEDILSVSCYYLGDYDNALKYIKIVSEHNPNDIRITKNYKSILLAKYEGIISDDVVGA